MILDRHNANGDQHNANGDQHNANGNQQPLVGEVRRIEEVSRRERKQMLRLMQRYYKNVTERSFETDFLQKDWVILAKQSVDGSIQGFSTQMIYHTDVNDQTIRVLFSGDTIVEQNYWAKNPLACLWGQFVLALTKQAPTQPLYWFLICKGYKTYRFLPVFFHEYFPRYDLPTPEWAGHLIDRIAQRQFGNSYDPACGIIRGNENACRLRESVADITAARRKDPHVEYFERINPGHRLGDELCCIAEISEDNFNPSAFRVMGAPDPQIEKLVHGLGQT